MALTITNSQEMSINLPVFEENSYNLSYESGTYSAWLSYFWGKSSFNIADSANFTLVDRNNVLLSFCFYGNHHVHNELWLWCR